MKLFKYLRIFTKTPLTEVALVLSGGGARGAIHLGVLKAFDENGIKVEAISGSSIGAIIGALYCAGISPLEIKSIMRSKKFASVFHLSWNKKGLLTMTRLRKTLNQFIPINDFKNLNIPFYCCISNLDSGAFEIVDSGDLGLAVSASASIPILFEPVKINGNHYVDGGLFNNLPVEPLLGKYNCIVGVHVNNYKQTPTNNLRAVAERVFTLVSKQNIEPKFKQCDFVIEPELDQSYRVLDFRHTDKLFEIGYAEGVEFIKKYNGKDIYKRL
jgi:NTE family protein